MGIHGKFRSKPFNKDGRHENMVECAKDLVKLFPSPSDLPWQIFYGRCARERGQYSSPSFGTDEHMFELYTEVCKEITSSTRGGGSVRTGRWWSIEERAEEKLAKRGGDAMVLCHMGIKKGWWPSYGASPLLQEAIEPKRIGPPPLLEKEKADAHASGDDAFDLPDGPEETGLSAGKAVNIVQERREDNEGTCHYIARMLSKPNNMRL